MSDLDADVRRFDEDRWLASRFAPADARARLVAIYALNHEIARTAEVVTTPQLIDIRLAWWREAIEEIYAGKSPRSHPVLVAFATVAPQVPDHWNEIIEARRGDEGFSSWGAVDAFIERTARAIMAMSLDACGIGDREMAPLGPILTDVALAWGYVVLARSTEFSTRLPGPLSECIGRAEAAYVRVRASGVVMPAAAFPAIGYVALASSYTRALRRGERETPLFSRQLRLIGASLTGRF